MYALIFGDKPARMAVWPCALVLALAAHAQAPAPPAQAAAQQGQAKPEATPLRVTTRLVQVNVIVQDKRGQPVADLTRDDFVLLDQGQPQTISSFSVESTHLLARAPQGLPPGVYSNRLERTEGVPNSVTLILLDGLNTRFQDMVYAREQIIKFLSQLQPQDRVALYTLTTRLNILHDFTSDAAPLVRAIGRYRGHYSAPLQASEPEESNTGNSELDAFINEANQRVADFQRINRALTTAEALEAIANHVARLPGRKNLIWVSGSFPFRIGMDQMSAPFSIQEARTFSYEIERAARALNNANLAVYPVDARGLVAPVFRPSAPPSARVAAGRMLPLITLSPSPELIDTMVVLAERTGGRAFYNTNDIFGSIRRAIADSRITYVLGYYPTHGEWNGKFREIKVQVKRPGLRVRYRRGYFALADTPLDEKQRKAALQEAVYSPLDATSVGLTVRADAVDVPGARSIKTEVQVEARDISLEQQSGRWVGGVDIHLVQRNAEGKTLAGETNTVTMNLSPQKRENVLREGLVLAGTLPLAPSAAQLRVIVRDATTGAIGSVSIPLEKLFPSGTGVGNPKK